MPSHLPRRVWLSVLCVLPTLLAGCHSHFVNVVIRNSTPAPITLVEVDYPSASFGIAAIAPGAEFHYRFKILGNGGTKIGWTDRAQKEQSGKGPDLHEGEQGTLRIEVQDATATWSEDFK